MLTLTSSTQELLRKHLLFLGEWGMKEEERKGRKESRKEEGRKEEVCLRG